MFDRCPPPVPIVEAAQPVGGSAPIDHAKVARLRHLISTGNYIVDPDRVAAALLATDLADLTRT